MWLGHTSPSPCTLSVNTPNIHFSEASDFKLDKKHEDEWTHKLELAEKCVYVYACV